jgi:hypothetical protein
METTSTAWLAYFQRNAARASPPIAPSISELPPRLRRLLAASLGRFWLGESGEGRIAHEVKTSRDPALDDALRESIGLYVKEEARHARELARMLEALGARRPARHWSESLFRRGRRALGLRTKMMVIAAAEVVGVVYYETLAAHVPALADAARAIADDERRHLDLQAWFFRRVAAIEGEACAARLGFAFAAIALCAIATVAVDHGELLAALGVSRGAFAARCWAQLGARRAGRDLARAQSSESSPPVMAR